ncbi:MAG: hypothetical protein ACRCWQ_11060 [Bacilli bacterium]
MNKYKYMTLKEAITEYIDVEDLLVFFYRNENYTFLEQLFFCEQHIDRLNCVQKILVELNLNTMCEVVLSVGNGEYVEADKIYRAVIRVGKTTVAKRKYREKFRRKEEIK